MAKTGTFVDQKTREQIRTPGYYDEIYSADGTERLDHRLERIDSDLMDMVQRSVSVHANATPYLNAYTVGKKFHLVGLLRVNTEIPIGSQVLTVSNPNIYQHSFPLTNIRTDIWLPNGYIYLSVGSGIGTNPQAQLKVGTYAIDTWFDIA